VNAQKYCADKLVEAKKRMAANHRKCEETAGLVTAEGKREYATARAMHESDRKQVDYWTAELAKAWQASRAA
jgi:hypothetical protein